MRLLFLILLLLNAGAFGYIRFAESRAGADNQLMLLQIAPEKMKLIKPAANPQPPRKDASTAQPALVCLEWGGFTPDDSAKAGAALEKVGMRDKVTQRESNDRYWVYIPPLKNQAEVDKKASELKTRGVSDFSTVQDSEQWRYAIAFGSDFKSDEAANGYLAQLRQKGVRSAVAGPRGEKNVTFVIRAMRLPRRLPS
jgi:SPOR domain